MNDFSNYQKFKKQFEDIGLAIPGTLREIFLRCGKSGCACATSDEARHGPYYLWDFKHHGKLTSKSISKDKVALYRRWIKNRIKLEALVDRMLLFGAEIAINPPPELTTETEESWQKSRKKRRQSDN